MKNLFALLILAFSTVSALAQFTVPSYSSYQVPLPVPYISNLTCMNVGTGPWTSAAIDTSGATGIVLAISGDQTTAPWSISDNQGNGTITAISSQILPSYMGLVQHSFFFYGAGVHTGVSHTFTFSGGSTACVIPMHGINGIWGYGGSGCQGTTTCGSSALAVGAGYRFVVSDVAYCSSSLPTVTPTAPLVFQAQASSNCYGLGTAIYLSTSANSYPFGWNISVAWGTVGQMTSFY